MYCMHPTTLPGCYSPHPSTQAWFHSNCMLSISRRGGCRQGDEQPGLSRFKGLGPGENSQQDAELVSRCCRLLQCLCMLGTTPTRALKLLSCCPPPTRSLPPLPLHSIGTETGGWDRLEMTGSQHYLPCVGLVDCLVSLKAHKLSLSLSSAPLMLYFSFVSASLTFISSESLLCPRPLAKT